jgi:hypothetical protein
MRPMPVHDQQRIPQMVAANKQDDRDCGNDSESDHRSFTHS